jgi:hypothetical protein
MSDHKLTIGELLNHPRVRDRVRDDERERIAERLHSTRRLSVDEVLIRILSAGGAWVAALCLVVFLELSGVLTSESVMTACGLFFLAAAVLIARVSEGGVFLNQLALAVAFTGSILVPAGAADLGGHDVTVVLITHTVVCAVMYPLYANAIYRFVAPLAVSGLALVWIFESGLLMLIHGLIGAQMLLAGVLLLRERGSPSLAPLFYAAVLSLPAILLLINLTQMDVWRTDFDTPVWPSSLLLAGGLVYVYQHLAGGWRRLGEPWMLFATAATVALGVFTTPGILVAVGLLVAGRAFGDRALTVLSYLFLAGFLFTFYYALNVDLFYKSYVVAGSGALLLVVRWIIGHYQPQPEVA